MDGTAGRRPDETGPYEEVGAQTPTPPSGIRYPGPGYFAGDLGESPGPAPATQPDPPSEVNTGDLTPPQGLSGVVGPDGVLGADGVIDESDFGRAAPAVLGDPHPGGPQPDGPHPGGAQLDGSHGDASGQAAPEQRSEADDWPKLEYRSRNKPRRPGAMDWIRRRRDG